MTANVLAASSSLWVWYFARAAGLVSLVALTGSVVLGIVTSVHWASARWPRFTTSMLHRNLSLLAVAFLAVHITTVVVDGFAPIGWLDVVVPFASPYRTLWLGLGTFAFDLVVALVATSLLRRRIGPRAWRVVHWLAYVCWPVALVHGLGTGTDTASVAGLALSLSCAVAVTAALWWRLSVAERGPARSWSAAAAVGLPVIIGLWLLQGPLAPGWAARAGTPSRLVASAATGGSASATNAGVTGATTSPPTPLSTNVATSLDGSFNGTVSSTGDGSAATLEIDAVLTDAAHDHLAVVLQGVNDAGNFLVRSGTVTITSTQGDARFLGQLSSIVGDTLYTSPTAHSPSTTSIAIQLASFDRNHGNASGSVRAVSSAPDREHREGDR